MTARMSAHRYARLIPALLLALVVANPSAQTKITPEKNSYSVADDVKVGQEAAAEAKKQLPMLNDDQVDKFVERVGARLAAAIDGELRHAGFRYTFDVVNQKEINAFALPGGPMFLNRGMIEAAKTEAAMAGVMAHEIAHVALRQIETDSDCRRDAVWTIGRAHEDGIPEVTRGGDPHRPQAWARADLD